MGATLGASDLPVLAGAAWGAGSRAERKTAGHGPPDWRRARRPPGEAGTRESRTSSSWRAPRRPGLGTEGPLEPRWRGRPAGRQEGRSPTGVREGEGRGDTKADRRTDRSRKPDGHTEGENEGDRDRHARVLLTSPRSRACCSPSPPSTAGSTPPTNARASVNPPSLPQLPHPRAVPGGSTRLRSLK